MSTSNTSSIVAAQDTGRTIETTPLQPSPFQGKRFLPFRKTIFSNDQEVFIDSPTPLILLSDNNVISPFSPITKNLSGLRRSYLRNADTTSNSHNNTPSKRLDGMEISEGEESVVTKTVKSVQSKKELEDSTVKIKDSTIQEEVDIFKVEEKETNKLKSQIKKFINSQAFGFIMGIAIIYALFANDIRQAALPIQADTPFDVLTITSLVLFTLEIILTCYVKVEYRWSFMFWLDFISTLSVVLDVTFVNDEMFPSEATNAAQLARSARATRVGARIGRILRVMRLFQGKFARKKKKGGKNGLRKVFPSASSQSSELERLYDPFQKSPRDRERRVSDIMSHNSSDLAPNDAQLGNLEPPIQSQFTLTKDLSFERFEGDEPELRQKLAFGDKNKSVYVSMENIDLEESRVGRKLSELTTKRVIVIVFALLLIVPMFSSEFWFSATTSSAYELNLLQDLWDDPTVLVETKKTALNNYISDENKATISLALFVLDDDIIYIDHTVDFENLRDYEVQTITIETKDGNMVCTFRKKIHITLEAGLNIGRTCMVIIVLTSLSLLLSKDSNDLVLRPIERMIEKVNRIARNPLIAKEQAQVRDVNAGLENETVVIENAIIKIGGLLALGFGDAGSTIIAKNMALSGDLNPMLAGKKMAAIFGFCDIRNFTDATEVLQEGVMVFVNSIADIVHSTVDKYTGAANKNIGDAFLLVWKLPDELVHEKLDGSLEIQNSKIINNMADLALISFLKIHARVNRDPTLLSYRQNPGLNARLPNYKVKMGYGMHIGWAIEGAIGSEFKVDASYLSPNVNMAARLEAATKQYGVPLLFSGELYHRLSKKTQSKARIIDIVKVKGSDEPIELYTCEMDVEDITVAKSRDKVAQDKRREKQLIQKQLYHKVLAYGTASSLFDIDKELIYLFRNHDPNFLTQFQIGFDAYQRGDWSTAKKKFEECMNLNKDDGPTKTLMNYLRDNDFIPPEDWDGYRVLTEK